MPPLIVAFWVLIGFGGVSALWGPPHVWEGPDPTTHNKRGEQVRGFFTTLSAPSTQEPQRNVYGVWECRATVVAVSLGQRLVRVQIDGVEQPIDWSWSADIVVSSGHRRAVVVRYIDPMGGQVLASHEVAFRCGQPALRPEGEGRPLGHEGLE